MHLLNKQLINIYIVMPLLKNNLIYSLYAALKIINKYIFIALKLIYNFFFNF